MDQALQNPLTVIIGGIASVIILLVLIARMFRKVGPNQALIVYGFGGTQVVTGGGKVIVPMFQSCRELSLELMSFDVSPQTELYTHQGVAVLIDAVTQIKVRSDAQSIRTAAEQFLDKSQDQREALIQLVMEGHLRGIVGLLTVEQIVKEPEMVSSKMRDTCSADMEKMGLEIISFTIKEVRDKNEYIANMGRPEIERVKKEANIATAAAQRDTEVSIAEAAREARTRRAQAEQLAKIAEAEAEKEARIAQAEATRQIAKAEAASAEGQAEAHKDLELKKAAFLEEVQRKKAFADRAYEIQSEEERKKLVERQVLVAQTEREALVAVQEAEIKRREKELIATVLKPAEMEKLRIEALAEAERLRILKEAEARAQATRLQGEAEAAVIAATGAAEAKAMQVKAAAFAEYTQAAIVDKLISSLPEVVRALAQPLSHVDKITVVSTGANGTSAGLDRVTGDLAKLVAQVPALFETLSGMKVSDLMRGLPGFAQAVQNAAAAARPLDGSQGESSSASGEPAAPAVPDLRTRDN